MVEELNKAGIEAHLAEPADTRALRGPKKRAKTDRLVPPGTSGSYSTKGGCRSRGSLPPISRIFYVP